MLHGAHFAPSQCEVVCALPNVFRITCATCAPIVRHCERVRLMRLLENGPTPLPGTPFVAGRDPGAAGAGGATDRPIRQGLRRGQPIRRSRHLLRQGSEAAVLTAAPDPWRSPVSAVCAIDLTGSLTFSGSRRSGSRRSRRRLFLTSLPQST